MVRPSFRPRLVLVGLAATIAISACGSDASSEEAFCADAKAFQTHQRQLELVLFDPDQTKSFFQDSVVRISALADEAPPTVSADVSTVRDGFIALDDALAEVDYNVLLAGGEAFETSETDAASDRINEFLAAACRTDDDPITGFGDDPLAPAVLSPAEIRSLQAQVDDENSELSQLMTVQLADEFGLTEIEAKCLVDELDVSLIAAIAGGDAVTTEASDRFVEALGACGLDVGSLGS